MAFLNILDIAVRLGVATLVGVLLGLKLPGSTTAPPHYPHILASEAVTQG
jgi:hypothetical protein